jgi:hypothetical protein
MGLHPTLYSLGPSGLGKYNSPKSAFLKTVFRILKIPKAVTAPINTDFDFLFFLITDKHR